MKILIISLLMCHLFQLNALSLDIRYMKIFGTCDASTNCVEFLVNDHKKNFLGYNKKTGGSFDDIDGGAYGEDFIPELDQPSPSFKSLEIVNVAPGVYTLTIIATAQGKYVIETYISINSDNGPDLSESRTLKGIVEKGDTHTVELVVPIESFARPIIQKKISAALIQQEIKVGKKHSMIPKKLADNLLRDFGKARKMIKKGNLEGAKNSILSAIKTMEDVLQKKSFTFEPHLSSIQVIMDEARLLEESLR